MSCHKAEREQLRKACLKLESLGITQGTLASVSCRTSGGFLLATLGGLALKDSQPQRVFFVDLNRALSAEAASSHWRLHYDLYGNVPEAAAVVQAHPTFCAALSCKRLQIPAFHYMVAAAGGKEIRCADYAAVGTPELSENMLQALGNNRSVLLANHGMICHGPNLSKVLWLANETECLARQYMSALSTGVEPNILPDAEMDVVLAKFKSYGKKPSDLAGLTEFERRHAIEAPGKRPPPPPQEPAVKELLPYTKQRQEVIDACLSMNRLGINQGTSGNASCRVPGGFLVTASGVPYEQMGPEHVVFMDLEGQYAGDFPPSSEWRMHYDVYKAVPEAFAVLHTHATYCTALSCQARGIPAFHYMVAAAGGKEICCSDYATFGTQALSDSMLKALGHRRSTLLGNHGMICHGPDMKTALWLANETECLARQYISTLATGGRPVMISDEQMDSVLEGIQNVCGLCEPAPPVDEEVGEA